MSQVVGTGVIELIGDARKLVASVESAKKSIRTLGEGQKDVSAAASQSIDRYIGKLQQQNATLGKSVREVELFKLAMRGASNEQLNAANAALRFSERQENIAAVAGKIKAGLIAAAAAATTLAVGYGTAVLASIDLADHLKDLSKSTGISVEDLAGLRLLAKQTGTDLDGLAKGINKMSVELGKDPEAFRALGVTAKDSLGAFKQLADIFNVLPDLTQRNALAQKIFSKSWQELAPALSEGSRGITEAIEKGKRLSGITKEMADRADEFNDRLAELKVAGSSFGLNLLPTLTEIVTQLSAATVATGSLTRGISALASLKAGNFGSSISEQLKEIDAAQGRSDTVRRLTTGAFLTQGVLDIRDAALADMKKTVQALQREQALALPGGDSPGEKIRAGVSLADRVGPNAADAAARAAAFLKEKTSIAGAARDTARQEAQAQLAFDLEQIRKASDVTIGAFANSERIMEAMRAAALVDDRDYYASKLGFIQLNARQQEAELQQEIERLQRETFAGADAAKDRINNARRIAEAEAKIGKVRADADANVAVNSIQKAAALDKVTQAYEEASKAAAAYIDTIAKQNAREIAGIGKGNKFREQQAGADAIDDRRTDARRKLQTDLDRGQITQDVFDTYIALAENAYTKEVELYRQRTIAIEAAEADWTNGAREALQKYYDESRNIAKQTEDIFTNAFRGLEDALVEFTKTGKLNFKSLADSILTDINRMSVKQNITGPLAEALGLKVPRRRKAGGVDDGGEEEQFVGEVQGFSDTGDDGLLANIIKKGLSFLPSFDTGIAYVPQTMPAILHQGERVLTREENARGGGITLHQRFVIGNNTDSRSQEQVAAAAYRGARRAFERGTA